MWTWRSSKVGGAVHLTALGIVFALLATRLAAHSQQAGPPTVALLFLGTAGIDSTERSGSAVREGLRAHGWVEIRTSSFNTDMPMACATASINWPAS
jgi:hypothetical protein